MQRLLSEKLRQTIQIPGDCGENPMPTPVFDSYIKTLTNGNNEILQLPFEFIDACISNIKGYRMKKALFLLKIYGKNYDYAFKKRSY